MGKLFRLLVWLAFCLGLSAYDLNNGAKAPLNPLAVTLDFSFATTWPDQIPAPPRQNQRHWLWSSHLVFNGPVAQITDGQLWQIAFDAWSEIDPDRLNYDIGLRNLPGAMTVLAFSNELILASSQKGSSAYSYKQLNTPVSLALEMCQMIWRDDGEIKKEHQHKGKCGEPMSMHLYYLRYPDTHLSDQGARIGTVVKNRDGDMVPTDPCGNTARVSNISINTSRLCEIATNILF